MTRPWRFLSTEHWLVGMLVLVSGAYAVAEELNLITFYPSPRGVYKEILVQGTSAAGSIPTVVLSTPGTRTTHEARIDLFTLDSDTGSNQRGRADVGDIYWSITARGDAFTPPEGDDLQFRKHAADGTETVPFMVDFATGNVGLGTTNPGEALQVTRNVNGTSAIRIGNANTGAGAGATVAFDDGATTLFTAGLDRAAGAAQPFLWTGTGQDLRIGTGSGGSSAERIRIAASNGNVGIGTGAAPNALLDVNGTAEFSNRIGVGGGFDPFTNGGTAGIWTSASANDPTFFYGIEDPAPGAEKAGIWTKTAGVGWMVTYGTDGWVGLGTATPLLTEKLRVAGNALMNGTLRVDGVTTFDSGVAINGKLTAGRVEADVFRAGPLLCLGGVCRSTWPPSGPGSCTTTTVLTSMVQWKGARVLNSCVSGCPAGFVRTQTEANVLGGNCDMITCVKTANSQPICRP